MTAWLLTLGQHGDEKPQGDDADPNPFTDGQTLVKVDDADPHQQNNSTPRHDGVDDTHTFLATGVIQGGGGYNVDGEGGKQPNGSKHCDRITPPTQPS